MSNYTSELVAIIEQAATTDNPLNLERAKELAALPEFVKADISHQSIIAKARDLKVPYERKVRLTKSGEAVMRKADMAAAIAKAVGFSETDLKSLAKAEKGDLRALMERVQEMASQEA